MTAKSRSCCLRQHGDRMWQALATLSSHLIWHQ